jgi:carbonic anhydrase
MVTRLLARLSAVAALGLMSGGCSLLPFGGHSEPKAQRTMRPEIHEVAENKQPDCIAEDEPGTLPATTNVAGAGFTPAPQSEAAAACMACACGAAAQATTLATPTAATVAAAKPAALISQITAKSAVAIAPAAGEAELQRLMDGNKRFVEGESENGARWPQRPGNGAGARRRPPAAMVLTCSDWPLLPESAFDAMPGELFVVRVAGNVASDSVIDSASYAIQQYEIPLIIVLGHENCDAVAAAAHAGESRPAAAKIAGTSKGNADGATMRQIDANVAEAVARLRGATPSISARAKAGRLSIIGASYNETNGQISLTEEPDATPLVPTEPTEPVQQLVRTPLD